MSISIGGYQSVATNTDADVILSVLTDVEVHNYGLRDLVGSREWHVLAADDRNEEEICEHFEKAHKIIRMAMAAGKKVLVHCAHGVSRSPTIVAAYLMIEHRFSQREAMEWVIKWRPIASPNDGFMEQLKRLETFNRLHPREDETSLLP
jgi:protein-tyrosine phosphatase